MELIGVSKHFSSFYIGLIYLLKCTFPYLKRWLTKAVRSTPL